MGTRDTVAIVSAELTIPSGKRYIRVQKEVADPDDPEDIETISGGSEGMRIILVPYDTDNSFTLKHNVDNIWINAEGDHTANNSADHCELIYNGSTWYDLSLK